MNSKSLLVLLAYLGIASTQSFLQSSDPTTDLFIDIPLSFEGTGFVRLENATSHIEIMDITFHPSLDSEGNRAKCSLIYYSEEIHDYVDWTCYLNFTSGIITMRENITGVCHKVDVGMKLNATDVMKKALDPQAFLEYEGKRSVSWDVSSVFLEFTTKIPQMPEIGSLRFFVRESDHKVAYG